MTRTEARELLMQLLFQMEIQNDYSDEIKDQYLKDHFETNGQRKYAQELCTAVISHLEEIDQTINANSSRWNTKRMAKVDLAIIRLALAEVLYMDSIPDAVAINEAVDMAKIYSAEESKKFINGVLGQIVKKKMKYNSFVLGIDTSNYKTSAALVDAENGKIVCDLRQLLRVKQGERGLRQSDALFQHIENLPSIMERVFSGNRQHRLVAVAYSSKPRPVEGSYMPVFRAGEMAARSIGAAMQIPVFSFSHQEGHIEAIRSSSPELQGRLLCYHLSGGTSELLKVTDVFPEKIGGSKDLAFGQVLDRVGVAAGMKFPAGEEMDQIALKQTGKGHRLKKIPLDGLEWNLSGIETQCSRAILAAPQESEKNELIGELFQKIADALITLTQRASEQENIKNIMFTGGVAGSKAISQRIKAYFSDKDINIEFGNQHLSQDNAVGIALLGRKALWQLNR